MMFALADRDKRIIENMKRDGELSNEFPNVPYFSVHHHLSGSPVSRVSLQSSEHSPSSSFSNGFCSSEEDLLYSAPPSEEAKDQTPTSCYLKSPRDFHNVNGGKLLVDEMGLSQSFNRMNIRDSGTKMKGFKMDSDAFGFPAGDACLGDNTVQYNAKKYSLYDDFTDRGYDIRGFQSSSQGEFEKGFCDSPGSFLAHNQSNDFCPGSGWYCKQRECLLEQRKKQERSLSSTRGNPLHNPFGRRPNFDDTLGSSQLTQSKLDLNFQNALYNSMILKQRTGTATNGVPQSHMSMKGAGDMEAFSCEDGFFLHGGRGLNHVTNKRHDPLRHHKKNFSNEISLENMQEKSTSMLHGLTFENDDTLSSYIPLPEFPTINSLCEVQGYVYAMAQDQNGCRFLQRVFDEGTSRDVQMIFNEIINHVVELMLKPFGNYVIQKLLDVCSEEQRLQIVLMVTKEPGQLIGICLNTYGTRVIQKLIETLKTRQQISLIILTLKPGFLDLIKDQNGNHVIQRCLQCLSNEQNKFIFDAAGKFCVDIASHRHGCCVMQRCIAHSIGKQRDKLIAEVSKNGLLLAQDPFGNYVVQYVIELKNSSSIGYLLSQFKGHYIHLSMQKFSSHVVEKCLRNFEESRPQIVHELLSVSHFEQLMQDPYANYVIQSALQVTKHGPLHAALVQAVQPHMILRTSPYCKRIFSRSLLKK